MNKLQMFYKKYSKYKDSGIEWLGEIPEEWRVLKIRHLGRLSTSSVNKKIKEGEKIVNLVNFMDVYANLKKEIGANIKFMKVSASDEQIIKNDLQKGDVLFMPSSETVDEIGFSAVVVDNLPNTLYSYHILRLRFIEDVDIRYKRYIFNNYLILNKFSSKAVGTTRMILRLSDFKDTFASIPSKAEQIKIANYLDKKTEKINAIIEKNKKQIELLKERRQAIISQAVTKGLNPKAKMKDSGIEWLGEIPERWELKRLRFLCRLNPPKSECKENINIGVTFLSMDMVSKRGEMNKGETRIMKDVYEGYTYFRDNDVLLAKITPCFENGKGVLARNLLNGIGFGTTEFHVLRAYKLISPEYLYFITYSVPFRKIGQANMIGAAGQKRIPENFVKNFIIGIPSIKEQNRIILRLKNKLADIELLMDKIQLQNQKLQEFRQSLISNAVTGKIKIN